MSNKLIFGEKWLYYRSSIATRALSIRLSFKSLSWLGFEGRIPNRFSRSEPTGLNSTGLNSVEPFNQQRFPALFLTGTYPTPIEERYSVSRNGKANIDSYRIRVSAMRAYNILMRNAVNTRNLGKKFFAFGRNNLLYSLAYQLVDNLGLFLGQRDILTPPAHFFIDADRMDGSHNIREFVSLGEAMFQWLTTYEGLEPTHRVLDIGCGIGRLAIPLTRYLHDGGTYTGIDITKLKIAYCKKTVKSTASNFSFIHADIYNKYYNPGGKLHSIDYQFPFADQSFDFIILISVFTHMLPEDLKHYVSEISRLLAPGGICIASFFLDAELDAICMASNCYRYSDECYVFNLIEPEHGVYYREEFIRTCFEQYELKLQKMQYGSWTKRPDGNPGSLQDNVKVVKANL